MYIEGMDTVKNSGVVTVIIEVLSESVKLLSEGVSSQVMF